MIGKGLCSRPLPALLAAFLLAHSVAAQSTLFSYDEPISQLSFANFSSVIPNSPKLWVVEFYAAWCGYCKRMAPEFSKVARNIEGWSDVVGMAVVACSEPVNSALCRNYDITGYPVIKFFPPNSQPSYRGEKYAGDKMADGLRNGIAAYVNQMVTYGGRDRSWPKLNNVRHPQELWQSSGASDVFIVVENSAMSTAHLGLMVILDSLRMRRDVVVGRMPSQEATRYGASSPGLYRATSSGVLQEITRDSNREAMSRKIHEASGQSGGGALADSGAAVTTVTMRPFRYTPPDGLHSSDLESSLYYSLWVEIPSRVSFDGELLNALTRYINTLARYHPGSAHVKKFLRQLNDWLSRQRSPLSAVTWLEKLNSIQSRDAYITASLRWSGCRGSESSFRGYPCSLWMTFHAITVSAYVKEKANPSFNARDVLSPIADYIRHFFSCRECATNFARRAGNLATMRLAPRDVVLWFWKIHNQANADLHNDQTEDPFHPKVQFPSYEACPSCRDEAAAGLRFNVSDDAWREDTVLEYLVRYYGEDRIIDDEGNSTRRPHLGGSTTSRVHVTTGSPTVPSCPSSSSSDWTPCSRTCDTGVSVRMTQSQASGCQLMPEVRFCLVRPCVTQFPSFAQGANCSKYGHTYRLTKSFTMSYGNCSLTTAEAWRVCGLCPPIRNRPVCCRPLRSSTQMRETACLVRSEGRVRRVLGSTPVEVVDFCKCDHECG